MHGLYHFFSFYATLLFPLTWSMLTYSWAFIRGKVKLNELKNEKTSEVFRWNISLIANLLFLKSVKSTVTSSSSFFSILFIFYLPCSSFGLRCPWRPKDFLVRCPDISIPVHQWQRTKDCHLEPTLGNLRLDCQLCKWPEINQRLLKQNWYYCTECICMYWFLNIEVL